MLFQRLLGDSFDEDTLNRSLVLRPTVKFFMLEDVPGLLGFSGPDTIYVNVKLFSVLRISARSR